MLKNRYLSSLETYRLIDTKLEINKLMLGRDAKKTLKSETNLIPESVTVRCIKV